MSVGTFQDVVNSGSNYAKLLTSDDGKSSAPSDMESYDCHQPFVRRSPTKVGISSMIFKNLVMHVCALLLLSSILPAEVVCLIMFRVSA